MKYLKFLGLIVASVMLVSCGSSGGGGGADVSSGTSTITIAIGGTGQASIVEPKEDTMFARVMEFVDILSPAEAVAGTVSLCEVPLIPRDVSSIAISITGGGITPPITDNIILSSFDDHCETVIRTYTVPNGTGRVFHANALNGSGDRIYEGTTVKDISGADYVQIFMGAVEVCEDYDLQDVSFSYDWDSAVDDPVMSNSGDDNYFVYQLPWSFRFYGNFYNQITVDSNGNIWFEYEGYDYEFDLASINGHEGNTGSGHGDGHGPVISAWNLDLSSYSYGDGYMVLHKTDPERVVIRWNTETYDDEDDDNFNEFEVILYPNGDIRIDYDYFECTYCDDEGQIYGSGISKGDGSSFISINETFGAIERLARRSFLFNTCEPTLINDCVPTLILPEPGTVMDNGASQCDDPLEWSFDWSDCTDATSYDIRVLGPNDLVLPIEASGLAVSNHEFIFPVGIVLDRNRIGWTWQVRAMVNGQWGDWSTEGTFDVEPLNTDCQQTEPDCADVSGVWTMQVSNINSSCGTEEPWSSEITINQTVCDLEVRGIKETTVVATGSVVGDTASIGPDHFPDGWGTTTATYTMTLQPDGSMTGNESWTWDGDEGNPCSNGTADLLVIPVESITHNGVTYGTVTSADTGRIWLDRNLGASQVCTAIDDIACYGDKYQWGRNYDGHQVSTSATTAIQATDITNAGTDFITGNDWTTADSNGTLRTGSWNSTDGTSVCPVGYRVPTTAELDVETTGSSSGMSNATDAFNSFLKLPSDGYRGAYSGIMSNEGVSSVVWTSDDSGTYAYGLNIQSSSAIMTFYERAYGFSVRCIEN